jgi:hypothetical protein
MESALCSHEIHLVQTAYGAQASFSIRRERRPHPHEIRLAQAACLHESALLGQLMESRLVALTQREART